MKNTPNYIQFRYTGTMIGDIYTLYYVKGGKGAYLYKNFMMMEDTNGVCRVDEETEKRLFASLDEFNAPSWNGFYKNNKNVLDGYSADITVKYPSGEKISAVGYNESPEGMLSFGFEMKNIFFEKKEEFITFEGMDFNKDALPYIIKENGKDDFTLEKAARNLECDEETAKRVLEELEK